ncbi:hypothetical protein V7x_55180 [Crateriforma conspicua]|uniref:Glycosyltransferase RgtA/B/C/D-like domain-containing protein n=2 Tax=Planctomycetaceae TaxID=126 RepID=A0A5C6FD05_9PLAN|nr:hypothetical protein V7x_55180 [Crateriforma conspicua]
MLPTASREQGLFLGSELFFVGESLYRDGCFADPFGYESGATGWVAPLIPTVLMFLLWITGGSIESVAIIVLILHTVMLASMTSRVIQESRQWGSAVWGGIAVSLVFCSDFEYLFLVTHDCVSLAFFLFLACYPRAGYHRAKIFSSPAFVGLSGGLLILASPVIGFCWFACRSLNVWRKTEANPSSCRPKQRFQAKADLRGGLIGCVVASMVVVPWCFRNQYVLGLVAPVKTNAMFELYQSMYHTNDGIPDASTFLLHPAIEDSYLADEYRRVGEAKFLQTCSEKVIGRLRERPDWYLNQVGHRLLYSLLRIRSHSSWNALGIVNAFVYAMPFVISIGTLFIGYRFRIAWLSASVFVIIVFLVPYWLISFYSRYAAILFVPRCLLTSWLLSALFGKLNIPQRLRL